MTLKGSRRRLPRQSIVINRQRIYRIASRSLALFSDSVLDRLSVRDKQVAIALVSDSKIRQYNARFLGRDSPTDVISFRCDGAADELTGYLGDILISVETAARNARRYRLSLSRELKNLIIHGLLHLLGYGHEPDARKMRALERRLRRDLIN